MRKIRTMLAAAALLAVGLLAPTLTASAATTTVTVVAAGDIACAPVTATTCQQAATEQVAAGLSPKYLFALGDLAYPAANLAALNTLYAPSWGLLKSITKPVPGNHEGTGNGYYTYFAGKANPQAPACRNVCQGYYSFSTGSWHVIALNTSACVEATGVCPDFTAQIAWLTADIKAHPAKCTLAVMHHPYWSVGGSAIKGVQPLYAALIAGHVDLAITGHLHAYERFAPQDATGTADPNGLTEIVAGTGGASLQPVGSTAKNRVAAFSAFGVLGVSLSSGGWTSSFHATSGVAVRDTATGKCH